MQRGKVKKSELIHYRLQAMLRENNFSDLADVGVRDGEQWYSVGGHEVPVNAIEELERTDES